MACSIFFLYLDDIMRVFEKIKELVIWDWYFSGRMETINTKEKGNEKRMSKYCSKTMCTHIKWANKQMLRTELCMLHVVKNEAHVYYFFCKRKWVSTFCTRQKIKSNQPSLGMLLRFSIYFFCCWFATQDLYT